MYPYILEQICHEEQFELARILFHKTHKAQGVATAFHISLGFKSRGRRLGIISYNIEDALASLGICCDMGG